MLTEAWSLSGCKTPGLTINSVWQSLKRTGRPMLGLSTRFKRCTGRALVVRSSEALITAVYQYEVSNGLTVQPKVQYIRHPDGGATNPQMARCTAERFIGMRTLVKF